MVFGFASKKTSAVQQGFTPLELVDLHAHILPAVDDGARDMDQSLALLAGLGELGYVEVAATPHFDNQTLCPSIEEQNRLIAALSERRPGQKPRIFPAAEILFDDEFVQGEKKGQFPTLAAPRTYLVEFRTFSRSVPLHADKLAFKLIVSGVTLILAHPERCPDLMEDKALFTSLRRAGMLFQLDLLSTVGRHGSRIKRLAQTLIENRQIDCAASDLHQERDLPYLHEALLQLSKLDRGEFTRLVSTNPKLILQGRANEVQRFD